MPISCAPRDLAEAARCLCFDNDTKDKVEIYLLAVIAGLSELTPEALAVRAKCYCYDAMTIKQVKSYLLCQIANLPT